MQSQVKIETSTWLRMRGQYRDSLFEYHLGSVRIRHIRVKVTELPKHVGLCVKLTRREQIAFLDRVLIGFLRLLKVPRCARPIRTFDKCLDFFLHRVCIGPQEGNQAHR